MEMDHFSLKNKTKQKKQTQLVRGDGSVSKRFLSKRKGGHELDFQHPHGGRQRREDLWGWLDSQSNRSVDFRFREKLSQKLRWRK